jgi:hypothetical protein
MVYFKQRPYDPQSDEEIDQWKRVIHFRNHFPEEGLWWRYRKIVDFKDLLREHLEKFIRANFPLGAFSGEPALSDNSAASGQLICPLTEFQNAYRVPDGIINDDYITAIADIVFDLSLAVKVIGYVDRELKKLDPQARPLRPGTLVFRASAVEFWQSVFDEAQLGGHRTVASVIHFLLGQRLPATLRETSSALLAALRKDYERQKGGPA